jgi:hypothetical protein
MALPRARLGPQQRLAASRRKFSDKPEDRPTSIEPPPTMRNVALAAGLFGFVTFVFTYSMQAVGRSGEEEDPLSQLKAEAQEARGNQQHNKRLTKEEIEALESGTSDEYDEKVDIAEIEAEANLKVFATKQEGGEPEKKKKAWYRFGL